MELNELGTIELKKHQHELLEQFAEVILDGTVQQAVETFEIIFEREPANELEMQVFKALCEQKIKEQNGGDYGIRGVLKGGKGLSH